MNERRERKNEEGAQWATAGELRAGGWLDTSGWPLGHIGPMHVYLPRERQQAGTLVIAPPGAGKSRGILVPAILSEARQPASARRSIIVLDPAGELYRLTAPTLAHTHRVTVWNPAQPYMSNTFFDALAYIGSPLDDGFPRACDRIATCWYTALAGAATGQPRSDPFWDQQAVAALRGLIIARATDVPGVTMSDFVHMVGELDTEALIDYVQGASVVAARLQGTVLRDLLKSPKTAAIVFGELRRRLLIAADPTVEKTIGRPSVDVAAFVAEPTALYLQIGTGDTSIQPLLSVALSVILAQITGLSVAKQVLQREVRVIVDELQNIGELHDLAGALNTLRGYGIGFLLATQTRAGLFSLYGRERGEAIIGACNTLIGLGGLAPDDASWFSRSLGTRIWEEVTSKTSWRLGGLSAPVGTFTGWNPKPFGPRRVSVPLPMPHKEERTERRQEPLAAADSLRTMDRRLLVVPARMRALMVDMDLHTGD